MLHGSLDCGMACVCDGGPMMIDRMLGSFPNSRREWIEFIIASVLLLLLMMAAVSDPELVTVG